MPLRVILKHTSVLVPLTNSKTGAILTSEMGAKVAQKPRNFVCRKLLKELTSNTKVTAG
jgi:hypothetical protein